MNNRTELLVKFDNETSILDTYEFDIELNFQITDITEIQNRRSSFSKSIKLPMTKNNRIILKDITNPAISGGINPNKKVEAIVMVDTIPVFRGNIQLVNATIDDVMNKTEVEAVLYSDNDDLFKTIGEKYIHELDFSSLNHIYGSASQMESWNATASCDNLGYYYPMIDYGDDWSLNDIKGGYTVSFFPTVITINELKQNDLLPALYVKNIFDTIFREAGYTYDSYFLNSDNFKRLIVPFTGDTVELDLGLDTHLFRVGLNNTITMTYSGPGITPPTPEVVSERIYFDNTSSPNGDPYGLWSIGGGFFSDTDRYVQRFGMDITIEVISDVDVVDAAIYPSATINFFREYDPNTGSVAPSGYPIPIYSSMTGLLVWNGSTSTFTMNSQFYTDMLDGSDINHTPLFSGEKVWVEVSRTLSNCPSNTAWANISSSTFIFNEPQNNIFVGGTINMNSLLPLNIKQKDFLTSIIKMFNLYIEPVEGQVKKLNIEPRDDFYSYGQIVDWSKKLDISQPIEEEILSNTQYRTIYLTYKEDSDYYNTDYTQRTNRVYGEYKEELDNDFLSDENKIEITFSPTPLISIPGSTELVIPKIAKFNNQLFQPTTANIRILYKNADGLLNIPYTSDYFSYEGMTMSSYPYAGHFDNPFNPQYDINFGLVDGIYYKETDITGNNLVNNYWKKQFDEYNDKNSKIIKAEFYLKPTDLYDFSFNKKVFLDIDGNGQYYRVLAIEGYVPGVVKTCSVTLLKVKDITVQKEAKKISPWIPDNYSTNALVSGKNSRVVGRNNIAVGDNVYVRNSGNLTIGNNTSNLALRNSVVIGDYNTVEAGAYNINVSGDGNYVSGSVSNVSSYGNNNVITANNVVAIGDNNVVNTPDTVAVNGVVIPTLNYYSETTTPGSEEAKIEIINGAITSYVDVLGTGEVKIYTEDGALPNSSFIDTTSIGINLNSSDGTNNSSIFIDNNHTEITTADGVGNFTSINSNSTTATITADDGTNTGILQVEPTQLLWNGSPITGGTTYVYYTENTTPGSEEGKIQVINGAFNSYVDVLGIGQVKLYSENGTDNSSIQTSPVSSVISTTDGFNTGGLTIQPTNSAISASDGTIISKANFTSAGDAEIRVQNGSAISNVLCQNGAGVKMSDYDGSGNNSDIKALYNNCLIKTTNSLGWYSSINTYTTYAEIKTTNGTNTTTITNDVSNGVDLSATDGTTLTQIQVRNSLVNLNGISFYKKTTTTSNNTPTTIQTINTSAGSIYNIKVRINGLSSTNGYGAQMFGVFKNIGGTLTQISTTDLVEKSNFSTATTSFSISGTDILIKVTGESGVGINWSIESEVF